MARPKKCVKPVDPSEKIQDIVAVARELEADPFGPDPDKFYILNTHKVFGMPVPRLAQLTLLSKTMLYYCINGKSVPSSMVCKHICAFINMDPLTFRELCKACKHERNRRHGLTQEPSRIPPPLFHYFKVINGVGHAPKMEGKYKEMVDARRGQNRKAIMKTGREWFDDKAKKIAEQSGFAPDENGIYRKDQSESVVQALVEILGTPGLDEG